MALKHYTSTWLRQQLAERDQQLAEARQQLAERDQQLADERHDSESMERALWARLSKACGDAATLEEQLAERDQQLAERDQQLADALWSLQQLQQQLDDVREDTARQLDDMRDELDVMTTLRDAARQAHVETVKRMRQALQQQGV